jgi:hypothetical protein
MCNDCANAIKVLRNEEATNAIKEAIKAADAQATN